MLTLVTWLMAALISRLTRLSTMLLVTVCFLLAVTAAGIVKGMTA